MASQNVIQETIRNALKKFTGPNGPRLACEKIQKWWRMILAKRTY